LIPCVIAPVRIAAKPGNACVGLDNNKIINPNSSPIAIANVEEAKPIFEERRVFFL